MNPPALGLQNLNEVQRKTLIDSIRAGECVIVLGPYANVTDDGQSQRVRLAKYLVAEMPTETPISPEEQESLGSVVCQILLDRNYKRGDVLNKISSFYKQKRSKISPNSPYGIVMRLGFRTIFSTDPDSWLMRGFDAGNRDPLGLYFTQVPQPDIVSLYNPANDLTDETPIIINLFGASDRPDSLAIGPEEELRQIYALTSGEMRDKINLHIAPRLARCRWYLFVGFNFNSWMLGSIFYFFNKLTEKIKEARVFGLHSEHHVQLTDTTVAYYKNLFPVDHNKDDVRIVNSDAQSFFAELSALADQFPPPPPPPTQFVFVLYHPKDRDRLEAIRSALEAKFEEYGLTIQYNQPPAGLGSVLTPEQVKEHILTDDVVLYLFSTNWEDDLDYDPFLDLAQQRDTTNVTQIQGIKLDEYNISGPNRQLKPAFGDGSIKLRNRQQPLNLPTDLNGVIRELDEFLEENLALS